MKHNAFTLIELIIVVSIIAILAAIAIPAIQRGMAGHNRGPESPSSGGQFRDPAPATGSQFNN